MGTLGNVPLASAHGALHCGCPELYSVEGSPRISCAARRHVTLKYILLLKMAEVYLQGNVTMIFAIYVRRTLVIKQQCRGQSINCRAKKSSEFQNREDMEAVVKNNTSKINIPWEVNVNDLSIFGF